MDISIRIAGEAGQGIVTAGNALTDVLAEMGLYIFGTRNYESRIRGGVNWFDIRVGDRELFSRAEKADMLVAFSQESLEALTDDVTEDGVIVGNGEGDPRILQMDLEQEAKDTTGKKLMANSVALGVIFGLLDYDVDPLCDYLKKAFKKAGDEVVEQNIQCVRRGSELAQNSEGKVAAPQPADAPPTIYDGGTTTGMGGATAGVKFVTGYPMTPGTAVLTYMAKVQDKYGIVVEQAEDELAAVNMVCGATYAGVPALTSTSGGGFALMCEGLSLSGMMELPICIVIAQRPGPATGLPTRTSQQDLKFVLSGGHGEFPRAVFAPGTHEQAYEHTRRALEIAHKYQSPSIILIDQFLTDCQRNIPELSTEVDPIDRHILEDPAEDYVRYAPAENGVSPRALPGSSAFVVCDSDEHNEQGHITESMDVRMQQQDKRMEKEQGMIEDFVAPERRGPDDAETVLVTWGSTYMPAREAVDRLIEQGESVAMVHFPQVWPLDVEAARDALGVDGSRNAPRVISVEGNATGQFGSVLREQRVIDDYETMLRYDGRPFSAEEITERFNS